VPLTDLAALRREYEGRGLDASDVDPDPVVQFGRWFAEVRDAGYFEPNAMVLATVDAGGRPAARTVLLKGVDARGFAFYTNYTSAKARELEHAGWAALTFSWSEVRRQIRVVGPVARVGAAESDAYFATRPRGSQIGAWASDQSASVATRAELDEAYLAVERRFAGADVPRPAHWGGYRVAPHTVELWQGRENRLHDRLRYSPAPGSPADGPVTAWTIERIAP
jgi:pyridoxamine 5'-phosphate oxidase